jgi:hypothetical protein
MGFLASHLVAKAKTWLFVEFPAGGPGSSSTPEALVIDQTYVEIWLESMQITNRRKFFTKYISTLTSEVTLEQAGNSSGHFFVVIGPDRIKNSQRSDKGNIIIGETLLAGPAPYRGGPIGLDLGLFRLKAGDLAEPYVAVLSEMAIAAGINSRDEIFKTWDSRLKWLDNGFAVTIAGDRPIQEYRTLVELRNAVVHGQGHLTEYQSRNFQKLLALKQGMSRLLGVQFHGHEVLLPPYIGHKVIQICRSAIVCLDTALLQAHPMIGA